LYGGHGSPYDPPMKRRIQLAISSLIAIAIVWYLFRDINWEELYANLRDVSVPWLLLSQIPLWISFITRIERWKYIVRSGHPTARWRGMFSATQIGFLANFVLPARAGEFIRPYALTRLEGVPFTKGLAMTGLDRVADLCGLLVLLLVTMVGFRPTEDIPIPPEVLKTTEPVMVPAALMQQGASMLVAGLLLLIGGLVVLYLNQNLVARIAVAIVGVVSRPMANHVRQMIINFSQGLHIFRNAVDMLRTLAWTIVTWSMFTLSTMCIMNAFGLEYPWYAPLVVQVLVAIGIGVPISPGFIGQLQLSVMIGLILGVPGISYEKALALGLFAHVLNFVPVLIAGIACLMLEDLNLFSLRKASDSLREAEDPEAVPETPST